MISTFVSLISLLFLRYTEELGSVDDIEELAAPTIICLVEEQGPKSTSDVSIGMITICPSTGDVVWDDFDGN